MELSVAQIIGLLVKACAALTVFSLGLKATWQDLAYLPGRPLLFARSLLAMYVVTPLVAVLLVHLTKASMPVEVAVLLMAISAGAPALPKKLLKAGANAPYAQSLSVIAALLAIVSVPVSLSAMAAFFGRNMSIDSSEIASTITIAFLAPLFVGMVVRHFAPPLAERTADPILKTAGLIALALSLVILATNFSAVLGLGLDGLVTIAAMVAVSLAIGHFLGGPEPKDRTTLAIACATRFPGLGLLIASIHFPNAKPLPLVVGYLLVSTVVVLPYVRWRKTQHDPKAA